MEAEMRKTVLQKHKQNKTSHVLYHTQFLQHLQLYRAGKNTSPTHKIAFSSKIQETKTLIFICKAEKGESGWNRPIFHFERIFIGSVSLAGKLCLLKLQSVSLMEDH